MHLCRADEDAVYSRELKKHIRVLNASFTQVSVTDDDDIAAGEDRTLARRAMIDESSAVVLLTSVDFVNSDACQQDMNHAINRLSPATPDEAAGTYRSPPTIPEAPVIAMVICRSYDWAPNPPPSAVVVLPTNRLPVINWPDRDIVYTHIVSQLRSLVRASLPEGAPKVAWLRRSKYRFALGALLGILLVLIIVSQSLTSPVATATGQFRTKSVIEHVALSGWPLAVLWVPISTGRQALALFLLYSPYVRPPRRAGPSADLCRFCSGFIGNHLSALSAVPGWMARALEDGLPRCDWCTALHITLRGTVRSVVYATYLALVSIAILLLPAGVEFTISAGVSPWIVTLMPIAAIVLSFLSTRPIRSIATAYFVGQYTPQGDERLNGVGR